MYVCICSGVTDRELREAVGAGTVCIENMSAVLGVGACCGCCRDAAHAVIAKAQCEQGGCVEAPSLGRQ